MKVAVKPDFPCLYLDKNRALSLVEIIINLGDVFVKITTELPAVKYSYLSLSLLAILYIFDIFVNYTLAR